MLKVKVAKRIALVSDEKDTSANIYSKVQSEEDLTRIED